MNGRHKLELLEMGPMHITIWDSFNGDLIKEDTILY